MKVPRPVEQLLQVRDDELRAVAWGVVFHFAIFASYYAIRPLRDTFGVPLYEEDVMCVAAEVAGLSLEDGDLLRRAIAGAGRREPERIARIFRVRARRRAGVSCSSSIRPSRGE